MCYVTVFQVLQCRQKVSTSMYKLKAFVFEDEHGKEVKVEIPEGFMPEIPCNSEMTFNVAAGAIIANCYEGLQKLFFSSGE